MGGCCVLPHIDVAAVSFPGATIVAMRHTRTLDPNSPQNIWDYSRWALDDEAAIAWPGHTFVDERIEPAGDKDGLIRIIRTYSVGDGSAREAAAGSAESGPDLELR